MQQSSASVLSVTLPSSFLQILMAACISHAPSCPEFARDSLGKVEIPILTNNSERLQRSSDENYHSDASSKSAAQSVEQLTNGASQNGVAAASKTKGILLDLMGLPIHGLSVGIQTQTPTLEPRTFKPDRLRKVWGSGQASRQPSSRLSVCAHGSWPRALWLL